eukprot:TRINITY_DN7354_c0_g1_i1.p1 TRINITY_DN7354_c0_g1~~TRINITY_DN7354_c0_g1_i1.p1  ORF type:complete len:1255 (-),score=165.56 TRINITY_DN7354_c0_g1_i1:513-4277(-)
MFHSIAPIRSSAIPFSTAPTNSSFPSSPSNFIAFGPERSHKDRSDDATFGLNACEDYITVGTQIGTGSNPTMNAFPKTQRIMFGFANHSPSPFATPPTIAQIHDGVTNYSYQTNMQSKMNPYSNQKDWGSLLLSNPESVADHVASRVGADVDADVVQNSDRVSQELRVQQFRDHFIIARVFLPETQSLVVISDNTRHPGQLIGFGRSDPVPNNSQGFNWAQMIPIFWEQPKMPCEGFGTLTRAGISGKYYYGTVANFERPTDPSSKQNMLVVVIDLSRHTWCPSAIFDQHLIQRLRVSNGLLYELPLEIQKLTSLISLEFPFNQIQIVDEVFSCLTNLERVDLSENAITTFPTWIFDLPKIGYLNLSSNLIKYIPARFSDCPSLQVFDVRRNPLSSATKEILSCIQSELRGLSIITSESEADILFDIMPPSRLQHLTIQSRSILDVGLISRFTSLNDLNVSHNRISSLPNCLSLLCNLTRFVCGHNKLSTIPQLISSLDNLIVVGLQHNMLDDVSFSTEKHSRLEDLNLSHNFISTLQDDWSMFPHLHSLNLSHNLLLCVPKALAEISSLCLLDLTKNRLTDIPSGIILSQHGISVSLEGNQIPEEFLSPLKNKFNPQKVFKLSSGVNLPTLPEIFGTFTVLTRVGLNDLGLHYLPDAIGNLTRLVFLSLSKNRLSYLPKSFSNLSQLQGLDLSINCLGLCRDGLSALRDMPLKVLNLSSNGIQILPQDVLSLSSMSVLSLSDNNLTSVSDDLFRIPHLHALNLAQNYLTEIPSAVCEATALEYLGLSNNFLVFLPPNLSSLTKLTKIDSHGNPLSQSAKLSLLEKQGRCSSTQEHQSSQIKPFSLSLGPTGSFDSAQSRQSLTSLDGYDKTANYMQISNCNMSMFMTQLRAFTNLNLLHLSNNQISVLPESIVSWSSLLCLNLSQNQLSNLPYSLSLLTRVECVDVSHNYLLQLPDALLSWTSLRELNMSANWLQGVSHSLDNWRKVNLLNFSQNLITAFPLQVTNLLELRELNLSSNLIGEVPIDVTQLTNKQFSLNICRNPIIERNALLHLHSVHSESLNFQGFYLPRIDPAIITQYSAIKSLDLSFNNLSDLPDVFTQLSQLASLNLDGNYFQVIPPEIHEIGSLTSISMDRNPIFPSEKAVLDSFNKNLTQATFVGLRIPFIPCSLMIMKEKLSTLIIRETPVRELPSFLTCFAKLASISISNSPVTTIPRELKCLKLHTFSLHNTAMGAPVEAYWQKLMTHPSSAQQK